jgi:HAD superfamily hydrolase (TIGR01509 family)
MNPTLIKAPLIALIGLPNSGKSTLINRLTGGRNAITAKEEHTTRDLNYGEDYWEGMYLRFVDTGGLVPDPEDKIQREIQIKSWSAITEADMIVWVIDRKQNPDTISDKIMGRIWKTGKPVLICINKVDDPNKDADVAEYAKLGGFGFINISAQNGYNLSTLADMIVEKAEELGFERGNKIDEISYAFEAKKRTRMKEVRQDDEGRFVIVRENSEDGPGMFSAIEDEEYEEREGERVVPIQNVVFDFNNVVFLPRIDELLKNIQTLVPDYTKSELNEIFDYLVDQGYEVGSVEFFEHFEKQANIKGATAKNLKIVWDNSNDTITETEEVIKKLKKEGKKLYYLTNSSQITMEARANTDIFDYFDGGVSSHETETRKPDLGIYTLLVQKFNLDTSNTIFVDDRESNLEPAREIGMWGVHYNPELTDLEHDIYMIESGQVDRVKKIPSVILLGKPNVGKSSLFNAMTKKDLQIVTEIAGTTMSVNDYLLERVAKNGDKSRYILLDSTGLRKTGQRTVGVESFASFRTIEAAYRADVILLVLDGTETLSHQDQVVAGVAKEAKKGMVMVLNKADKLTPEEKTEYLRHVFNKFVFLKETKYVWVSAVTHDNLPEIWKLVDESLANRSKVISTDELRKLFNYLMKQKPPKKLPTKKKAVIYDLVYKHGEPPSFELLIKDKTSVHWSYVRFLENIIRKQFNFAGTAISVKLVEVKRKKIIAPR